MRLRHLADSVPGEEVVREVELLEVRHDGVQLGQALVLNVGVRQVESTNPAQILSSLHFDLSACLRNADVISLDYKQIDHVEKSFCCTSIDIADGSKPEFKTKTLPFHVTSNLLCNMMGQTVQSLSPQFFVPLDVLGDVQDALVREVVSRELHALHAEQPLSPDHPQDGVVHPALLNQESVELSLVLKYFVEFEFEKLK